MNQTQENASGNLAFFMFDIKSLLQNDYGKIIVVVVAATLAFLFCWLIGYYYLVRKRKGALDKTVLISFADPHPNICTVISTSNVHYRILSEYDKEAVNPQEIVTHADYCSNILRTEKERRSRQKQKIARIPKYPTKVEYLQEGKTNPGFVMS